MTKVVLAIVLGSVVAGATFPDSALARPRLGEQGLEYASYNYPNLSPETWDHVKPWTSNDGRSDCNTGVVEDLNFSWDDGAVYGCQVDDVAINFSGLITVPITGVYTFFNRSDDGFVMKINGRIIIGNWASQGAETFNDSGRVRLAGNVPYRIEIWYFEDGGDAEVSLWYNVTGRRKAPQLVPGDWLSHR